MRILNIQNRIFTKKFSFERRLRKDEEADFQKTNEEGFKAAGVDKRLVITHGSVFPAVHRDSHIGSPYGAGAKEWIKLLTLNGFNGIQLGPNGRLSTDGSTEINPSPYNASALNENHMFIDLEPLTTDKYGRILSKDTYDTVTSPVNITDKNYSYTDFTQARKTYYKALNESFKNFKANIAKGQPESLKLNKEYQEFLHKKGKQVEEEGIYRVLAALNREEDSDKWDNELDSNLMIEVRNGNTDAKARYKEILKNHRKSVDEYGFEQFITTKQIKENKDYRDKIGFKYYSDFLVGCSQMDKWRYKEAFIEGGSIGAREWDGNHQAWNIPVLNPRMLFIGNDKLNIGGEFLNEKIEHALEYCENTRIDHALGLIEPFVFSEKTGQWNFMSEIKTENGDRLDDMDSYRKILERIILPAIERHGLDKTDVVWEHICSEPPLFQEYYYGKYALPRLIQLEFMKDEFAGDNHWYLVGSHDSKPAMTMLDADDGWRRRHEAWNPLYLAGYLHQDAPAGDNFNKIKEQVKNGNADKLLKQAYKRGVERNNFCDKIANDSDEWTKAKFAELFTKNKIMVSFADLLGITDPDVIYNVGGSKRSENWKERIAPDFVDKYYENLSSDSPTALNIPEILGKAVKANIEKQIVAFDHSINKNDPNKAQKVDEKRQELNKEFKPLLDKLKHFEKVLKEKGDTKKETNAA